VPAAVEGLAKCYPRADRKAVITAGFLRRLPMWLFIGGFFTGVFTGILIIALVSANRFGEDEEATAE